MKSTSCGWRISHHLGNRSYGRFAGNWRRGKPRLKDEETAGTTSYMDHVANAASFEAFQRREGDPLLSAEALPENSSLIDFKAFAQDYPDKLAPLLAKLRPEFQEFFIEYYLLEKPQSFIGKTHGCIQTRVWQNLRIIEQNIGSMILLGANPDANTLRPILTAAGVEKTAYGSLTDMILYYAASHSYVIVAEKFHAPIPMIRKIFRPAIKTLLTGKTVKTIAVGAYLRSLTHQASLTKAGLSKSCKARIKKVKTLKFVAPPSENSPIMEFGLVTNLQNMPWCMLEISSDHRMSQIYPALRAQGKKIFGKKAAQIFAPLTETGELAFGYVFARCTRQSLIRALLRVRGISEISALTDDEGNFIKAVTVPHDDMRAMMAKYKIPELPVIRVQDFVEILTGPAAKYCGTVVNMNTITETLTVEITFPTGKKFLVKADPSCVKALPNIPISQRRFWGTRLG